MDSTSPDVSPVPSPLTLPFGLTTEDSRLQAKDLTDKEIGFLMFLSEKKPLFSDWIRKNQAQVIGKDGFGSQSGENGNPNDHYSEILAEILEKMKIMSLRRDSNGILCLNLCLNEEDLDPNNPARFQREKIKAGPVFQAAISVVEDLPPDSTQTRKSREGVHQAAFGGQKIIKFILKQVYWNNKLDQVSQSPVYSFLVTIKDDAPDEPVIKPEIYTKTNSISHNNSPPE